jgi:hypothetical protein
MEKLYKVLKDGKSFHGGSQEWPQPKDGKPGKWLTYDGELDPCKRGFHLTTKPAVWFATGAQVFEVETKGQLIPCNDDKVVVGQVRLVRELTGDELAAVQIFSSGEHEVKEGVAWAYGSSTVTAYGSSTVAAYGSSTVAAYGSSTVAAYDSSTVSGESRSTIVKQTRQVNVSLLGLSVCVDWSSENPVVTHAPATTTEYVK